MSADGIDAQQPGPYLTDVDAAVKVCVFVYLVRRLRDCCSVFRRTQFTDRICFSRIFCF
jgi:hypothetical protein